MELDTGEVGKEVHGVGVEGELGKYLSPRKDGFSGIGSDFTRET